MGILEAIETTLRLLELVEVRGKDNRKALTIAVDNLEAIVSAFKESANRKEELSRNEDDDQQGQDV